MVGNWWKACVVWIGLLVSFLDLSIRYRSALEKNDWKHEILNGKLIKSCVVFCRLKTPNLNENDGVFEAQEEDLHQAQEDQAQEKEGQESSAVETWGFLQWHWGLLSHHTVSYLSVPQLKESYLLSCFGSVVFKKWLVDWFLEWIRCRLQCLQGEVLIISQNVLNKKRCKRFSRTKLVNFGRNFSKWLMYLKDSWGWLEVIFFYAYFAVTTTEPHGFKYKTAAT